jgi:hypothetical protein
MKRLAVLALLLLAACKQPPVTDQVTVQFYEHRNTITVTATTDFNRTSQNPRIESARIAALAGTDPWSIRFARVSPVDEDVTFSRHRGTLDQVTRRITIPADDLQRVFSDTSITVNLLEGEGWRELSLYPGTSSRASREQIRLFEEHLNAWSEEVARYFIAIDHLYDYLDENPHRAKFIFATQENDEESPVLEEEKPLVEAVGNAMERILSRLEEQEDQAYSFAEAADLIFNPFPAKMTIRVPREKDLVIEPVNLVEALTSLEGKWVSPDPLAALLTKDGEEPLTSEQLAAMPRHSTSVINATEIATAIREQLARPQTYTIRWQD